MNKISVSSGIILFCLGFSWSNVLVVVIDSMYDIEHLGTNTASVVGMFFFLLAGLYYWKYERKPLKTKLG